MTTVERNLFEIKSDKISLSLDTKLEVLRYFWYMGSRSHHPDSVAKNVSSCSLACFQVIPCSIAWEPGCLTAYQPFASCSFSFRINDSQFPVSPDGIRSGFVSTPKSKLWVVEQEMGFTKRGTHQLCAFPLGHAALWDDWRLDFRNRLIEHD